RPRHSGVDHGAGLHFREPGGPGGDRHGRLRRQVRHGDQSLLLGGRHPGDGVPRHFHDAVLLRLTRPLGPGVPEAAVRREDPGAERHLIRGDDGLLLKLLLGWDFTTSVLLSALIVLAYIFLGGLTSAIYNEVLQFFLIVFGFAPLVFLGLKDVGGWHGLSTGLRQVALSSGFAPDAWTSTWSVMGSPSSNPMGVEWLSIAMGLGFVLSFGYWCTDF